MVWSNLRKYCRRQQRRTPSRPSTHRLLPVQCECVVLNESNQSAAVEINKAEHGEGWRPLEYATHRKLTLQNKVKENWFRADVTGVKAYTSFVKDRNKSGVESVNWLLHSMSLQNKADCTNYYLKKKKKKLHRNSGCSSDPWNVFLSFREQGKERIGVPSRGDLELCMESYKKYMDYRFSLSLTHIYTSSDGECLSWWGYLVTFGPHKVLNTCVHTVIVRTCDTSLSLWGPLAIFWSSQRCKYVHTHTHKHTCWLQGLVIAS